jgi:hypothetical protein
MGMTVGPNSGASVKFSLAASVNAGVTSDPAKPLQLHPSLDTAQIDILMTGNCKADYTNAYFTAYLQCGRGAAGSGGNDSTGNPISLTDVISYAANNLLLPLATKSIGSIELPSLDSILPGFPYSLTNVRLNQRGGFLAVYASLRPTPRAGIAVSTEQTNGVTYLRFFPTNLSGFDATQPTTYSWKILDHTTGLPVASQQYPGVPSAVETNIDNFATTDTNFGPGKIADATLTVTQSTFQITAKTTFTWNPPSVPPVNPCSQIPGTGGGNFIHAAIAIGGGGGGGAPGCPLGG